MIQFDYNKERKAKDWLLIEMLDRFKSKGIEIPFPHLTVKKEQNMAIIYEK